jgi:hypothetical protein
MLTRSHATATDLPAALDYDAMGAEELIVRLIRTRDGHEMAIIARKLGTTGDRRAIRPLLMRLRDFQGRKNADAEASICDALMRLGVMCRCGECSFCLRPRPSLPDDVVETIHELAGEIPWPYFGTRRI